VRVPISVQLLGIELFPTPIDHMHGRIYINVVRRPVEFSTKPDGVLSARLCAKLSDSKPWQKGIGMDWRPRLARQDDIPALERLIPVSVRTLQAPQYSPAQMEAALGPVFGVDGQLIRDGTYFVVERDAQLVGCG